MAIKKNAPKQTLEMDEAVKAAIGDPVVERGLRKARMSRGQKKKAARDQARSKVTFDWPEWLIEAVAGQAGELGVPANQLAAVLVLEGLRAVQDGRLDLLGLRIPSRTPAFAWFLQVATKEEFLRQR